MAFHPAIELEIEQRQTRIHLLAGNSVFQQSDTQPIIHHVKNVFQVNKSVLDHGIKHVTLIWSDNDQPMIDWWIWGGKESESEGSAIEVFLFRGSVRYESSIVTAEDGLKILASETN